MKLSKTTFENLGGELAGAFAIVASAFSGASCDLYGNYLAGKDSVKYSLSKIKR